jgi:hypothetical protein
VRSRSQALPWNLPRPAKDTWRREASVGARSAVGSLGPLLCSAASVRPGLNSQRASARSITKPRMRAGLSNRYVLLFLSCCFCVRLAQRIPAKVSLRRATMPGSGTLFPPPQGGWSGPPHVLPPLQGGWSGPAGGESASADEHCRVENAVALVSAIARYMVFNHVRSRRPRR